MHLTNKKVTTEGLYTIIGSWELGNNLVKEGSRLAICDAKYYLNFIYMFFTLFLSKHFLRTKKSIFLLKEYYKINVNIMLTS